jgi:hypothetical protein
VEGKEGRKFFEEFRDAARRRELSAISDQLFS